MIINVYTLYKLNGKKLPLEETYHLAQLTRRHKQILKMGPTTFKGVGEMSGSIFIVRGELSGTYILSCSRCLAEAEHTFCEAIEERFNLEPNQPLGDQEDDIQQVEGNMIDLLPIVEEEVLLSVPNTPICPNGTCQNELPTEGAGWSLIDEQMYKDTIDPRLADLTKFFEKK